MSNSPFKGKVTLLGSCVLTANCMNSSLCAVYGGLPSSFSGLCCPNHSPFFSSCLCLSTFPLSGSLIPKFLNLETPPQILAVFNGERGVPSLFIHCDVTTTLITSTKRKRGDQVSICIKGDVTGRVWSCVHSVRVSWIPDLFVLWNNIAEPMHLKPISLSSFTPSFHGAPFFLFRRPASASSLIHSEGPPEQSRKKSAVPVKDGKSPWGMTEEQKNGERERRREREWGNEEGRLAGKERWGEA